jgi:hypothetical protein
VVHEGQYYIPYHKVFKFVVAEVMNQGTVVLTDLKVGALQVFDYFEICKLVFSSSCGLNAVLKANGEDVKSSCGMQAVHWARDKEWDKLDEYCMKDTILTHVISSRTRVELPLTGKRRVCTTNRLEPNMRRRFVFHY